MDEFVSFFLTADNCFEIVFAGVRKGIDHKVLKN